MEFMQDPTLETLRWMRVIGDVIFAAGVVALGWFVLGLKTGWSFEKHGSDAWQPLAPKAPQPAPAKPVQRDEPVEV
jgi:nitric oxide reductase subunit B